MYILPKLITVIYRNYTFVMYLYCYLWFGIMTENCAWIIMSFFHHIIDNYCNENMMSNISQKLYYLCIIRKLFKYEPLHSRWIHQNFKPLTPLPPFPNRGAAFIDAVGSYSYILKVFKLLIFSAPWFFWLQKWSI